MAETFRNADGHTIESSSVRLDIYRLSCIYAASKRLADRCDDHFTCPTRAMLDDYEYDEITRLIISISIFGRLIEDKFRMNAKYNRLHPPHDEHGWMNHSVGKLIPDTGLKVCEALTLREAYNTIIHAEKVHFDEVEPRGKPLTSKYLRPYLYLYGTDNRRKKNWKATLDVREFISRSWDLASSV